MLEIDIRIIAVGRIKEKYLKAGIEDYLSRLKLCWKVEEIELPEVKEGKNRSPKKVLELEGAEIIRVLRDRSHLIVLAIEGRKMKSEELAFYLEGLRAKGINRVDFVIGGPLGLDDSVKKKGDLLLSLSDLTFPHRLVRLILMEQLYRSLKISRGEPYHK